MIATGEVYDVDSNPCQHSLRRICRDFLAALVDREPTSARPAMPSAPASGTLYAPVSMATASLPPSIAAVDFSTDSIPYAQTILGLPVAELAVMRRAIGNVFRIAHSRAYAERVDANADPVARFSSGAHGVFMGYDFHLTEAGPRLIEINTNAGGALLNGLHTAALCEPAKLDWLCCDPPPIEKVETRIVETFRSEFEAVRGQGARLERVAIVDERPSQQFLRQEFELFVSLFARHGIEARVADTSELARNEAGHIELDGWPVDLVYLRDTDFQLSSTRTAALREAHLAGSVVITPSPREHHLLADKRRLEIFSSIRELEALGVDSEDARFLAQVVPETRPLASMSLKEAWATRRDWVFKPAASFGSKAVYRGDKISKKKLAEIYTEERFLAQRQVAPGTTTVRTPDGDQNMKFDVRAYVYRDEILMLGARVYQGQVTNMRSPGGGFSAICVARDEEACCSAGRDGAMPDAGGN